MLEPIAHVLMVFTLGRGHHVAHPPAFTVPVQACM